MLDIKFSLSNLDLLRYYDQHYPTLFLEKKFFLAVAATLSLQTVEKLKKPKRFVKIKYVMHDYEIYANKSHYDFQAGAFTLYF